MTTDHEWVSRRGSIILTAAFNTAKRRAQDAAIKHATAIAKRSPASTPTAWTRPHPPLRRTSFGTPKHR